jgi:hypothetical protein
MRPRAAIAQAAEPDLTVDASYLESSMVIASRNFKATDCAVQQGCVSGTGRRKLLRFGLATPNIGSADLVLGPPQDNPQLFVWSPCDYYYHLNGYATFELLDSTGHTVLISRKQACCVLDDSAVSSNAGPAKYSCGNQGISAGWEDVYEPSLDCQWLDVTGVRPGNYFVRVTVNPQRSDGTYLLPESDHTNNVAVAPVTISKH